MHFQTVSVFLAALVTAASAVPPANPPAAHPPSAHPPPAHPPAAHPPAPVHPSPVHPAPVHPAPVHPAPAHPIPPCKPGHAWPNHHDCHSFFECSAGGQHVQKTCGPGSAYCWQTGVCVPEEDVPSCPNAGPAALTKGHGHPGPKGHH